MSVWDDIRIMWEPVIFIFKLFFYFLVFIFAPIWPE